MKAIGTNRKLVNVAAPAACQESDAIAGGCIERIAVAAYYRAQARGFAPGREVDDWLAAEREICAQGDGI